MDCRKQENKQEKTRVQRKNHNARKTERNQAGERKKIVLPSANSVGLIRRLIGAAVSLGVKEIDPSPRFWRDLANQMIQQQISTNESINETLRNLNIKKADDILIELAAVGDKVLNTKEFAFICKEFNTQRAQSGWVALDISAENSRKKKRHDRLGGTIRVKASLPAGIKHSSELSPFLNLKVTSLSMEDRIVSYSRRHKCHHGRFFNKWSVTGRTLVPECDHEHECVECPIPDLKCTNCGAKKEMYKISRICGCDVKMCRRCRMSWYIDQHGPGVTSHIACLCPVLDIAIEKQKNLEAFYAKPDKSNWNSALVVGQYIYKTPNELMEIFLKKQRRGVTRKVDAMSFSSLAKGNTIAGIFEEPVKDEKASDFQLSVEDFPVLAKTVTPHGAVASTFSAGVAAGQRTMHEFIDKLVEMGKTILEWLQGKTLEALAVINPRFAAIMGFLGMFLEAAGEYLKSKTILDLFMVFTALRGGMSCAALSIIVAEIATRVVAKWANHANFKLHRLVTAFNTEMSSLAEHFKEKLTTQDKTQMIAASSPLIYFQRVVCGDKGNMWSWVQFQQKIEHYRGRPDVNCDRLESCLGTVMTATPAQRTYVQSCFESCDPSILVSQQGAFEFISVLVAALPLPYQGGMFKSASLFCREVLPIIMVTKNIAQFGEKVWSWLMKTFGYMTTDNKTWLQTELRDPASLVFKTVAVTMDYKTKALMDHPDAKEVLVTARTSINELETHLKEEKRYDPTTIRLVRDLEHMLSTPLPPVARKHEPFCIRLWGKPGTGKSRSVPVLIGPIMGCRSNKEFYQKTYCRNNQEYWDGVGVRQCILYDDFGQNRADPVDMLELILLVSAAPFMANMANIVGSTPKGISIDPKIVVVNSNVEEEYTSQITEPAAIARRFHVAIHVTRKGNETRFSVSGGSMVTSSNLPKVYNLTLLEMQEFIHATYALFAKERAEGIAQVDELILEGCHLKTLLQYDQTGRAENDAFAYPNEYVKHVLNKYPVQKPRIPLEFDSQVRIQRTPEKSSIMTAMDEEGFPKPVDQQASLSIVDLLDCAVNEVGDAFLLFLLGTTLVSSFGFCKGLYENNWMLSLKSALVPAVTGLASITILVLLYKYNTRGSEVEQNSGHAKGKETERKVQPHGDQKAVCDIQAMLERALVRIIAPSGLNVQGVLIAETYLLTVEHIFVPLAGEEKYCQEGSTFYLQVPGISKTVLFDFSRERLTKVDRLSLTNQDIDVVVYHLPKCIPMAKNIIGKFWDGDRRLAELPGYLLKYQTGTRNQVWVQTILKGEALTKYTQAGKTWTQTLGYATHPGENGMCGCPIMLATGDTNSPIIGFHIASDNMGPEEPRSMFVVITKAMLKRALPKLYPLDPPEIDGEFTQSVTNVEPHALLEDTNLQQVGLMKRPVYNPIKTTLQKSLVFDQVVPHTTEPSVLHNKDPRIPEELKGVVDLYRDGINKMREPMKLTDEELEPVKEDMIEWYGLKAKKLGKEKSRTYTLFEVLNTGILKGMDLTTSPGFPFTFRGILRNELLIRGEDGLVRVETLFLKQLWRDLKDIERGVVPQWFFTTALKDERRPIEKVRVKPKTRLFTVCPLVYIILEKMFYAPFMEVLMLSEDVPYAGGVDRLGRSWHTMFARLRKVSDRGFGGDYECYDGKLSYELMRTAHDIMESVLDEKDLNAPFQLEQHEVHSDKFSSVSHSIVRDINALKLPKRQILQAVRMAGLEPTYMMRNFMFRTSGTLASGRWVTQLVGTLSGEILQRAAWNDLVPYHIKGGSYFKRFVAHSIMSDDNINAVVETALPYFNGETYSNWLAKRNMVYTSADKKGKALADQPLEEISFLKNTTGIFKGYFVPLMEWNAAVEQINWVRKSKFNTPLETLEMNANGALRALFYHGPEKFGTIRRKLLELQPDLNLETFNQLQHEYLTGGAFSGYQPGETSYWDQMNEVPKPIDLDLQDKMATFTEETQTIVMSPHYQEEADEGETPRMIEHQKKEDEKLKQEEDEKNAMEMIERLYYVDNMYMGDMVEVQCNFCDETRLGQIPMAIHLYHHHLHRPVGNPPSRFRVVAQMIQCFGDVCYTCQQLGEQPLPMFAAAFVRHGCESCTRLVTPHGDVDPKAIPLDDPAIIAMGAPLEEEPIVTSPGEENALKDPTDESRSSDNQEGTVLSDKGPSDTVLVSSSKVLKFISPRAEAHLNDKAWDLQRILQKWHHVTDIFWTTGSPVETRLYVGDVVLDLLQTQFAQAPFTAFKYFRCAGVRIKTIMIASKFHQGRAVVGFNPTMVPAVTAAFPRPISSKTLIEIGAVILDPSQGGESELYIPFAHPKGYLSLEQKDALGQLFVMVLAPLQVVTAGSQDVIIKMFFCLDKPEFKVPRASSLTARQFREIEEANRRMEEPPRENSPLVPLIVRPDAGMMTKKEKSQIGINEFNREGQVVGAVRAKTADPRTSHFGERETNLVNWGKRYRLAYSYTSTTVTANDHFIVVSMTQVLRNFWMMMYFNLIRGPLNFKVVGHTNTGDSFQKWYAYYEPQPMSTDAKYIKALASPLYNGCRSIAASAGHTLEFQIPFLARSGACLNPWHYKSGFQSTEPYFPSGKLFIRVKGNFTASSYTSMDLYVAFGDEFGMGVFCGVPNQKLNSELPWGDLPPPAADEEEDAYDEPVVRRLTQSLKHVGRPAITVTPHGLLDGLLGSVRKELSDVVGKALPKEVTSLALAAMDKPAINIPPEPKIDKRIGYMNFAAGPEFIDKFALHPSRQQLVDAEHFGSDKNEADLNNLFKRPSLLARTSWSVEQRPGDLLFNLEVGPTIDFDIYDTNTVFSPSIMCSIAQKFKYWRGGITFIFDVVCTNFHEGKLDFTFHPNVDTTPSDYNTRLGQYTVSTTIRATENRIALTVPYLGEEPFKFVRFVQPVNNPSATDTPPSAANFLSGILAVSVGASLRVPETVPPKVDILVYVLPASDFELAEMTMDGLAMERVEDV